MLKLRAESGPIRIAGESPGVFISGDDAVVFLDALSRSILVLGVLATDNVDKLEERFSQDLAQITELASVLTSAVLHL